MIWNSPEAAGSRKCLILIKRQATGEILTATLVGYFSFQFAHVVVPLKLDLFNSTDVPFEGFNSTTGGNKGQCVSPMFWRLEDKVG